MHQELLSVDDPEPELEVETQFMQSWQLAQLQQAATIAPVACVQGFVPRDLWVVFECDEECPMGLRREMMRDVTCKMNRKRSCQTRRTRRTPRSELSTAMLAASMPCKVDRPREFCSDAGDRALQTLVGGSHVILQGPQLQKTQL